ncbi:MAG: hypothetical protein HYW93_05135 [Thaumarchaeota archaeon]|nr:hypothetical protein [Nitrososphaerota archaeon]MBI3115773.1 hypothetical protein [Nitrososphaerota archaeon]
MVFLVDQGGEFDAPLEKVWKLQEANPNHTHADMQNLKSSMQGEHPILDFETPMPGGNVKQQIKMTVVPPVGFVMEYTDGPMKGTKLMQFYTPKGKKTGVTVIGELQSSMMSGDQLKKAVQASLDKAYKEDKQNLKKV